MITVHKFDLLLRVLLQDHDNGIKSASVLEIDLPPATGTDSDPGLCAFLSLCVETCVRRGHPLVLPAVSPGLERAWKCALNDEDCAECSGIAYSGARARLIRVVFEVIPEPASS